MNFKHVYLYLMLSGTFHREIYYKQLIMGMRRTTIAPGQLLRSVQMEKSYLGKAGNPPLEAAPGQRKTRVNSYKRQIMHRGKVETVVSELPRGNDLSRDLVKSPKELMLINFAWRESGTMLKSLNLNC